MAASVVLLLPSAPACGGPDAPRLTAQQVVQEFREAGLEVGRSWEMRSDDYGIAPMLAREGVRFMIPSLGEGSGGRVLRFDDEDDLAETKDYYDAFGKRGDLLFSWTFVDERHRILVQINGELPEEKARGYQRVLKALG